MIVLCYRVAPIITGLPKVELIGHQDDVYAVAYLPNNTQVVTGDADGAIILWDVNTGIEIRRFGPKVGKDGVGHDDIVYDIAVSPDGTRLLSASADGNVLLWDLGTGALLGEYK